jgi:hypothetical protein
MESMVRSLTWLVACAILSTTPGCSESNSSDGAPAGSGGATSGTAGATSGGAGEGGKDNGTGGQSGSSAAAGSAGVAGQSTAGSAGSAGSVPEAGSDATVIAPCKLQDSSPVTASQDGQVIEGLRIVATGMPAIRVNGHSKVTIRNVDIKHSGAPGISFSNADDILIENVSIEHTGAPPSGASPSADRVNIVGTGSSRVHINGARLRRGSSGIYLTASPDSLLQMIEGYDFRGPFPRGQLVQWDTSDNGVLEDFSVINPPTSWPEDDVNAYRSKNMTIRRGLVDGDNSPSGVGVIFDNTGSYGLVEDVDAVRMGDGCFSDYDAGAGAVFRRTRCRDNICTDQGRGVPLSNALMWAGHGDGSNCCRIEESIYFNSCNGNVFWPASAFEVADVKKMDFVPRAAIQQKFCWE